MLRNPFTKALWDGRRALIGWTVAVVAVGCGYAAFWPTIDSPTMREAIESYPEGLMDALNYDVSDAAGYLTSTVQGFLVAVLLLIHAIGSGSQMVAGDEETGVLDLLLAHPVSRPRLALERFAALVVRLVALSVALLLGLLAISRPADLTGVSVLDYAAMHLHLVLFATFFGAVAYAVGGATGRRTHAVAVGAVVAVVGYVANGIVPQVEGFEWVRNLSPFHWLIDGQPLENGLQPGALVLLVPAIVLVSTGTWAFGRRDLGT